MRAEMSSGEYPEELVELVARWFVRYFGASSVRKRDRQCARDILDILDGRLVPEGSKICDEYGTHNGVREHRQVITTPWTPAESAQRSGVAARQHDEGQ